MKSHYLWTWAFFGALSSVGSVAAEMNYTPFRDGGEYAITVGMSEEKAALNCMKLLDEVVAAKAFAERAAQIPLAVCANEAFKALKDDKTTENHTMFIKRVKSEVMPHVSDAKSPLSISFTRLQTTCKAKVSDSASAGLCAAVAA